MSSFENRGDTRRINDFGSRESSNRIDALPDMAKWFENEAAAEKALPRVVGKLPDLGGHMPAKKPKKRRLGRFVKNATLLTVAFLLGAASTTIYPWKDFLGTLRDKEETPASSSLADEKKDFDDWPDLGSLTSEAGSMFDSYSFDDSDSSSAKTGTLYSTPDDLAFSDFSQETPLMNGAWGSLTSDASVPNIAEPERDDILSPSYPAGFGVGAPEIATNAAVATPDVPAQNRFSGFQGYEFNQSATATPYASPVEETPQINTAERPRDNFLAAGVPSSPENNFNNSADSIDYAKNSYQNIAVNNTNQETTPQNFGYNSQSEYTENQFIATQTPSAPASNREEPRFADSGMSWNAPNADPDAGYSDSPFLEDRFNGEYVAQNFDDSTVETSVPSQKPARSIRW